MPGPFYYNGTDYSVFGFENKWTIPTGINDAGQIIGYFDTEFGYFAGFLFDGTTFITIAAPNGAQTIPEFINAAGEVVGYHSGVGFLYAVGIFYDLKPPGLPAGYVDITGITDAGEIYGTFVYAVPEPSTWAMLLIGFAGVGFLARRHRFPKPEGAVQL